MPEATFVRDWDETRLTAAASVGTGELRQLADGRAGFFESATAASSGDRIVFSTSGQVTVPKATGVKLLDGGRAYWDHSANNVTFKPANDRDFYAGVIVGDSESGDSVCTLNLNVEQANILDIARDPFDTVFVGTRAIGTMDLQRRGGAHKITLSSTSEAQKIDMLSQMGFAPTANAIVELIFNVRSDGAGTVVDASLGIANDTHASNADTITESLFVHLDANVTTINLESDDGTTEVNATDTTITYTENTPVEVWFDIRDPEDIQCYINGVLVLGGSVFKLNLATGPLKLLAHVEKSSAADTYEIDINRLVARIAEQ
jgi:predicted RecA/RadA family phage recombinase